MATGLVTSQKSGCERAGVGICFEMAHNFCWCCCNAPITLNNSRDRQRGWRLKRAKVLWGCSEKVSGLCCRCMEWLKDMRNSKQIPTPARSHPDFCEVTRIGFNQKRFSKVLSIRKDDL